MKPTGKLAETQLLSKTSFALAGLIFFLTVFLSWLIGSQVRARIQYEQGNAMADMAYNIADKIDIIIAARSGEIKTLAGLEGIANPKVSLDYKRRVLNDLSKSFPEFAWIGIATAEGRVVASTQGLLEGADISKRDWFVHGLKGHYFGDVHDAILLNKLLGGSEAEPLRFFDFATPLYHNGKLVGVLGAHLSWRWARDVSEEWLKPLQARFPVRLTIYSKEGKVLLGDKTLPELDADDVPGAGERNHYHVQDLGNGQVVLEGQARTKGSGELDTDGFGWVVTLDRPAKEAFAEATFIGRSILVGGFFVAFVLAIMGLRYRRNAIRAKSFRVAADEAKAAEMQAVQSSEAKSRFLATMSHEIRTPMNGVMGMTDLLLDTELNTEQRRYAELIKASAESLLSVINDILDFSKVEANKIELEHVPFGVSPVMGQVMSLMNFQARHKSIYLSLHDQLASEAMVIGDPARFRQVMVNLISNALKFTDQGGVDVYVSKESETGSQLTLMVQVKDTGVGISAEAQSRIFQRFEQADASTSRRFGGTGLGLSITKSLVELMGGEIGFSSESGKGSTFWFRLTLDKAKQAASAVKTEAAVSKTGGKLNILVAEDNTVNQLIIRGMLAKLGHDFTIVENGKLAVEKLQQAEFDLILMDCHMPEMDGYLATQTIRQNPQFKDLPIVAMTASAMAEEKERCMQVGMNDYLAKPLSVATVEAVLQKYMK